MPATSYTLGTLREAVLTEVQDPLAVHFTRAIVNRFINEELARLVDELRCRRATWLLDVVAEQPIYDLSDLTPRCLEVLRVALPPSADDTDEYELCAISMQDLDREYPSWRTDESDWPTHYTRWDQGVNGLRLYPTPASSLSPVLRGCVLVPSGLYGGIDDITAMDAVAATSLYGDVDNLEMLVGSLRLDGIAAATALTNDDDSVETVGGLPCQHQDALRLRVLKRCALFDVPIQQVEKAPVYEAEAQSLLERAKTLIRSVFQTNPGARRRPRNF